MSTAAEVTEAYGEGGDGCRLCPRNCGVLRGESSGVPRGGGSSELREKDGRALGFCGEGGDIRVARASLHMWEEPCISGDKGSGAVFFSGCALRCVYCQNMEISRGGRGQRVTPEELCDIFFRLLQEGAENINLVTGDHFIPGIVTALRMAKERGLSTPVVFNCSGYEKPETLKMLEGLVDIYLPDMKYMDTSRAEKYSHASDYPSVAMASVAEMVRQCPECTFDDRGLMTGGVVVRHLLLPGGLGDAKKIVRYLHETYGDRIYMSLMSQYTPMEGVDETLYPELAGRVKRRDYDSLLDYALKLGVEQAYMQERSASGTCYIPDFEDPGVATESVVDIKLEAPVEGKSGRNSNDRE